MTDKLPKQSPTDIWVAALLTNTITQIITALESSEGVDLAQVQTLQCSFQHKDRTVTVTIDLGEVEGEKVNIPPAFIIAKGIKDV